jgi:hypothetical protein
MYQPANLETKTAEFLRLRDAYIARPVYSLDETGFGRHTPSVHGYAPAGQRLRVRKRAPRCTTTSVLALASSAGIATLEARVGSFNTATFVTFLEKQAKRTYLPKRWTFAGTIDTDGTAMCAHFLGPKDAAGPSAGYRDGGDPQPHRYVDPEKYRVLGVDPERSNVLSMAEPLGTPGKHRSFTEAGINKANAWATTWGRAVAAEVEALSTASPKGASLHRFLAFLATWLSVRAGAGRGGAPPRGRGSGLALVWFHQQQRQVREPRRQRGAKHPQLRGAAAAPGVVGPGQEPDAAAAAADCQVHVMLRALGLSVG